MLAKLQTHGALCISPALGPTHRLLSSSVLWFIFRILESNSKKELLRSLWVDPNCLNLERTKPRFLPVWWCVVASAGPRTLNFCGPVFLLLRLSQGFMVTYMGG